MLLRCSIMFRWLTQLSQQRHKWYFCINFILKYTKYQTSGLDGPRRTGQNQLEWASGTSHTGEWDDTITAIYSHYVSYSSLLDANRWSMWFLIAKLLSSRPRKTGVSSKSIDPFWPLFHRYQPLMKSFCVDLVQYREQKHGEGRNFSISGTNWLIFYTF